MNSEGREGIVVDGEAVGLNAALSLGRGRRLTVIGRLMGMDISEPHHAIVAGGTQHPGGTS
jgi:hypothetical protein